MKNSLPSTKNMITPWIIPVMAEGIFSAWSETSLFSSIANTKDTTTMIGGLSFASHAVITAVKPSPPESWLVIECS